MIQRRRRAVVKACETQVRLLNPLRVERRQTRARKAAPTPHNYERVVVDRDTGLWESAKVLVEYQFTTGDAEFAGGFDAGVAKCQANWKNVPFYMTKDGGNGTTQVVWQNQAHRVMFGPRSAYGNRPSEGVFHGVFHGVVTAITDTHVNVTYECDGKVQKIDRNHVPTTVFIDESKYSHHFAERVRSNGFFVKHLPTWGKNGACALSFNGVQVFRNSTTLEEICGIDREAGFACKNKGDDDGRKQEKLCACA